MFQWSDLNSLICTDFNDISVTFSWILLYNHQIMLLHPVDISNSTFSSDAILSISGLTVFKQEAPSPTNHDAASLQIARQNRQSPTSTQQVGVHNGTIDEANNQNMINTTINQLLSQSAYTNLQNAIDANLVSSPNSQDNYNVTSTNYNFAEDCRFQYVLAAATSIATKVNEDTLTYLNQGQSYEIKLKKLGDLSMYRGKLLKVGYDFGVIVLFYWDLF